MEVRLLLSATAGDSSTQLMGPLPESTDLPLPASTTFDFAAAMGSYQFDTSVVYAEPDYGAFIQNSPFASTSDSATDPLLMQMSEYEAMMQTAQQQAVSATDVDAISGPSLSESLPGAILNEDVFPQQGQATAGTGDPATLANYVTEFTGGTAETALPKSSGNSTQNNSAQTQAPGTATSGPTVNPSNGTTSSSSDPTNTGQSEPGDPRLNWSPMQAPEGVSFNDSDFVGYSFIDDPFSVTPSGMESFSDQQTRITRFTPENTDPELGTGERQRATTTTLRTEQDYVSDQEWTVRYTLTNRYDDDELSTDSDETQTEVDRGYLTTLVVTVTNGTTATKTFTVSDSFKFGVGAIPGEEQNDDPWAIPESWMDTAEQSVNTATDTATSSSSGSQDSTASTNGSGFFIAAGYSTSFTKTTEKVTLHDGTAATRTTNSFNWSSSFSMRTGGSYNSSQNGSSTTDSVISIDETSANSSDNPTPVSYLGADSTGTTGVTANVDSSPVIAYDRYSGFQPVAKGQSQAFAMGSVAAAFSYTTTVPVNPLNLLSSTFSASAAFAVSALAGSNSNSSIKGDLNQSSGSEDDDTDEHLRIHVDNSDKASASAGFSFWFGIKVGNDSASSDSEVVDSPVNTTRSDSDEANPVSFTAEPSTAPGQADVEESNTESQGSKPGRQSASDMIQDNPTGIQLSLNTSNSSNVSKDFSFSEKTRSSHGYNLIADSDKKQTSSDVHFIVALGTEKTDLEFGKSKSSGTDVSMVRDQYSHNDVPGNLYHTAHFTDTYSEHTRSNEAFLYSMSADTPVTNTVFLKKRFDGSSRDYRSGELGTAIVLKTERYFNTTDRDEEPTGGSNSLDNTASDETPIYLYVESFTGAGGTIEYNRIEETPPYPIATVDASDNPVTPSDAIVNTQPFEQQRPVEDILAEYRDRATKIARWQARLNEPIDPGMRTYLEGLIASEQATLNTLATNAMNAGVTQSQLNELNGQAQTAAENDPIEWQEGDGGESVLLAAYIGFQFGKVQGILNSFNGVTDIGTGMINQGINVTNPLGWVLGTNSQIPLVDWSNGVVTDEDPVLHKWSKELGGNGIVLLASIIPFLPRGFKSGGLVPVDIRRLTYSSQKECAFANELMEMGTFNMAKYLENPAIVELKKNGVMVVQWGFHRIAVAEKAAVISGNWMLPVRLFLR
jgi:hypothetical protein